MRENSEHPIRLTERSLSVPWTSLVNYMTDPKQLSKPKPSKIYSVRLTLSALIKGAAAKIGKPHPAEEIKYV